MGFKTFGAETLTAADVNNFLMRQVVASVANVTAQNAIPAPVVGMKCYRADTAIVMRYNGTTWKEWESDWFTDTMTTSINVGTTGVKFLRHRFEAGQVHVNGSIQLGGTGWNMGTNATMNLPVTMAAPLSPYAKYRGVVNLYKTTGPANYDLFINAQNTSTTVASFSTLAGSTGLHAGLGSASPVAHASGDTIVFDFVGTPA